jgi:hypothetical protein
MADSKDPGHQKTLEMRVAELEDRLSQMHISEEDMQTYHKVASQLGAAPCQHSQPCVAAQQQQPCVAAQTAQQPCIASQQQAAIYPYYYRCYYFNCYYRPIYYQDCILGPMSGGGGGGTGGGGFGGFGT